jgi:hypothetical protein
VNTYALILTAADTNGTLPLSTADYGLLGIDGLTADAALLLNSVLSTKSMAEVDTAAELQALADIVSRVMASINGGTVSPELTLAELTLIGLDYVTDENLNAVLAAISAKTSATDIDSLTKLQAVVGEGNTAYTAALEVIKRYAQNDGTDPEDNNVFNEPDADDFNLAGVNLSQQSVPLSTDDFTDTLNTVLAAQTVKGQEVDTTAKIKAVVDAYAAILVADGPGSNAALNLTQTAYEALGLGGVVNFNDDGAAKLLLLNTVLDAKSAVVTSVDEWSELRALAQTVKGVIDTAQGRTATPALTAADLTALGLTGVTEDNLKAVLAAIAASDAAGVDTLSELSGVVSAALSAFDTALAKIVAYANDPINSKPLDSDFLAIGIDLKGFNAELMTTAVTSDRKSVV